jgi:tRNA-Thr(GGU) m(6)t(6)A37 methyltransferase TsaA
VDEPFRQGLEGLEAGGAVIALYWMHEARRDLIVQAPRHAEKSRGVFALRSPVRPNPVALAVVRVLGIDRRAGILDIDAADCLDGTPLIDLKPWLESIDIPPAPQGRPPVSPVGEEPPLR